MEKQVELFSLLSGPANSLGPAILSLDVSVPGQPLSKIKKHFQSSYIAV